MAEYPLPQLPPLPEESFSKTTLPSHRSVPTKTREGGSAAVRRMESRIDVRLEESIAREGAEDADTHGIMSLVASHFQVTKRAWESHNVLFDGGQCSDRLVPFISNSAVMAARWEGRSICGTPLIPKYHWAGLSWLSFMLLFDLTYTAFWVPLSVGFCSNDLDPGAGNACTKANLVGGAVYALNLLLRFQLDGDIEYDFQRHNIGSGLLLAWYYMRYGGFWIDLIAVIPFIYLVVIVGTPNLDPRSNQVWLVVINLFRLIRLIPLASISKIVYADAMSRQYNDGTKRKYNLRLSVPSMYMLILLYVMAVVVNLQACIMVVIASFEGMAGSWMTTLAFTDLLTESSPNQWYSAVYWVITTSTTTGYGDILPVTYAEMVISNVYMILGMVMFGLLVGTVGNMLTRANEEANKLHRFRKRIGRVVDWMGVHKIPDATRREIQGYFSDVWANREEMSLDAEIFKDLPQYMRQKLAAHVTLRLVKQLKLFQPQDDDLRALVAERLRPIDILPGADICQQGEGSDRFWLIQEGEVLALQHLKPAIPLHPPCLVGDSVLLADDVPACRTRIFTIRTLGVSKVWELRMSDCYPILRMYPELSEDFMKYVRAQMISYLSDTGSEAKEMDMDGNEWCESAASAARALKQLPEEMQSLASQELQKASLEDGSLPNLIEGLLNFSGTRSRALELRMQLPTSSSKQYSPAVAGSQYSPAVGGSMYSHDNSPLPYRPRTKNISSASVSNINHRPTSFHAGAAQSSDLGSKSWPKSRRTSLPDEPSEFDAAVAKAAEAEAEAGDPEQRGGDAGLDRRTSDPMTTGSSSGRGAGNSIRTTSTEPTGVGKAPLVETRWPVSRAVGRSLLSRSTVGDRTGGENMSDGGCSSSSCTACGRQFCFTCSQPLPGSDQSSGPRALLPPPASSSNARLLQQGSQHSSQSSLLASLGVPAHNKSRWRPPRGISRHSTLLRVSSLMDRQGSLGSSSIPVQEFGAGYSPVG